MRILMLADSCYLMMQDKINNILWEASLGSRLSRKWTMLFLKYDGYLAGSPMDDTFTRKVMKSGKQGKKTAWQHWKNQ